MNQKCPKMSSSFKSGENAVGTDAIPEGKDDDTASCTSVSESRSSSGPTVISEIQHIAQSPRKKKSRISIRAIKPKGFNALVSRCRRAILMKNEDKDSTQK